MKSIVLRASTPENIASAAEIFIDKVAPGLVSIQYFKGPYEWLCFITYKTT